MNELKRILGFVILFTCLVFFNLGCTNSDYDESGFYDDQNLPTTVATDTKPTNLAKLTIKVDFGEEESQPPVRFLAPGERTTLTDVQKQKVEQIFCSISDGDNYYYGYIFLNEDPDNDSYSFSDIKPGSYRLYVGASYLVENCRYTVFSAEKEIIIIPGQNNPVAISLYLNEWQPIIFSLPEQYTGTSDESGFSGNGHHITADGESGFGCWYGLSNDKSTIIGTIPLSITGEMEIRFEHKKCFIDADVILSAMLADRITPLSECQWEPITSTGIEVGFGTNYVVVPTDYPTIQSAIDAVSPGTTIKLNYGTYNESIVLKSGIRIEGSSSNPYDFVIESDLPNTILGKYNTITISGGASYSDINAEISGITICNTHTGDKIYSTAAVCCDLGFNLAVDHCIIESLGTGDCIVGNYTKMQLTNLTLVGSEYVGINGIALYNTSSSNIIENIIFCDFEKAIIANTIQKIEHSICWNVTEKGDFYFSETNCSSDNSKFIDSWRQYTPSSSSTDVKAVIERDDTGNYPGAIRPQDSKEAVG
ncbi:MAG: hypothetical protein ABH887_01880 [bacterium]